MKKLVVEATCHEMEFVCVSEGFRCGTWKQSLMGFILILITYGQVIHIEIRQLNYTLYNISLSLHWFLPNQNKTSTHLRTIDVTVGKLDVCSIIYVLLCNYFPTLFCPFYPLNWRK